MMQAKTNMLGLLSLTNEEPKATSLLSLNATFANALAKGILFYDEMRNT